MSKWAHFHIWAMRLTRLSYWFITAYHGGMEAGSNVFTCCDIWVLSLAFWIKVFGDKHHWLLSPCCYTTSTWAVPTCNKQNLGAIPSHLEGQKHLDDPLHSAGKASPLLSGLSYNHSQRTHGRLLELDIPKIEMGTAVVITNLGSILNNTTANIDIALTRCTIFLADWLIFMHLELFQPLALSFVTTSQRWWAWWRNTRKTSASSTWTRTWDVFCDALAARTHVRC